MSISLEFEQDIFFELNELERVIEEERNNYKNIVENDSKSPYHRSNGLQYSMVKTPDKIDTDIHIKLLNISSYELAEAEGEKEQLQDKISFLVRKTEENQKQIDKAAEKQNAKEAKKTKKDKESK